MLFYSLDTRFESWDPVNIGYPLQGDKVKNRKAYKTEKFTSGSPETNESLREKVKSGVDLSNLNTSQVTNMKDLFRGAKTIRGDITNWDTSNVTTMENMFRETPNFNQDIGRWNTSKVVDMEDMFQDAWSFNQYIGNWNTSNVRDMNGMFRDAKKFNQDIGNWDTSKVERFATMFQGAESFDQDLSRWCVERVPSKERNFDTGSAFQGKTEKQPQWGKCPRSSLNPPVHPPPNHILLLGSQDGTRWKELDRASLGISAWRNAGWDIEPFPVSSNVRRTPLHSETPYRYFRLVFPASASARPIRLDRWVINATKSSKNPTIPTSFGTSLPDAASVEVGFGENEPSPDFIPTRDQTTKAVEESSLSPWVWILGLILLTVIFAGFVI